MWRVFKFLITGFFGFLALVALGAAIFWIRLPDVRMMKGCLTTTLYQVHLCQSDANYVPLNKISPYMPAAVIVSEDSTFYTNPGVDLYEMRESAKRDWETGHFARGASTITQQLAKNVFLNKEKTLWRKAEEIVLALQIQKYFSKREILTNYLNVVEFGDHIYGVKAAARYYFHEEPSELKPEQAAFLAFLLPNPKKYNQSYFKHDLTRFAHRMVITILLRMSATGRVDEGEYQAALARVPIFLGGSAESETAALAADAAGGAGGVGSSDDSDVTTDAEVPALDTAGNKKGSDEEPQSSDDDFKFDF